MESISGRSCVFFMCWLVLATAQPQYTVDSDLSAQNVIGDPGAQSEPISIIFDDKKTIVNPGDNLNLDCGVSGDYRYCHWDNGRQPAIQVQDVYDGYIDGLSKPLITKGNECGIIINSVTIEDHGTWTCKVFIIGNSLQGTKNITVTIKPTNPIIEVPSRPLMVNEGDTEAITCSVAAARPKVSIQWFLGDEDITYHSNVENSLTDNMGTYKSISTLTHTFKAWHNRKALKCSVLHHTLIDPLTDYVDIAVKYKPWGKDVRLYGIQLLDDVEAKVNFSSNPDPFDIKWGYGVDFESIIADLPVPGEEGRYSTEMLALEDGHFSVILRVLQFDEMDAQMSFKVTVMNNLGFRDFRVTISNEKPPNDDIADGYEIIASSNLYESQDPLSSGAMAGIVVVVLLASVLLLCAVYMRYNHLYCFATKKAAKDDKEANTNSDTESAQAPGFVEGSKKSATNILGKLQSRVKKNKQTESKPEDSKDDSTSASAATDEAPNQTVPPQDKTQDGAVGEA